MRVLIDMEVHYYLFSEGERDLAFLGLCNYWFTRTAGKLERGNRDDLVLLLSVKEPPDKVLSR